MPYSNALCLGFWVGIGSRDEPESLAGVSHFLEHLLFKGTSSRTAKDIAEQIDSVGGDMNAFTTKEYTAFYIRLLADDIDLGLEILCDILTDPSFLEHEVASERQVILEEVLMHLDEPSDLVVEHLFEAMYPEHPLGRDVLGIPSVISSVSVEEIKSFFKKYYRPGNMVFSAAGNLDHVKIASYISSCFTENASGLKPKRQSPSATAVPLKVLERDTEQAQIAVGIRAIDRHSPDRYALSAINQILGGGLASRLFQKIREEKGLAYSIGSERVAFEDTGALVVSVGTNPANAEQVLELTNTELDAIAKGKISQDELNAAKKHLCAEALLSIEDSGSRMSRVGASLLLHNDVLSVEEIVKRIEATTLEDAIRVSRTIFTQPKSLSVVGPFTVDDWLGYS
jgi:predicted Zn-dependent peptidase